MNDPVSLKLVSWCRRSTARVFRYVPECSEQSAQSRPDFESSVADESAREREGPRRRTGGRARGPRPAGARASVLSVREIYGNG